MKPIRTYTVWYVLEEPPAGFRETLMAALQKHTFREIDIPTGKSSSIGWVAPGQPWKYELDWAEVFLDPYVVLTLREDILKIPATNFRIACDAQEWAFLHRSGRSVLGEGKLTRPERAAIKADVMQQLRGRALAVIATYELAWNTDDGTVRLSTHNRRVRETVEDLIRETWGIGIVPQAPGTEPALGDAFMDLEPADLVGALED